MVRSCAAVLAGYLIFAVSAGLLFAISGRDPHQVPTMAFAVCSIVYGMAFAFLGGWVSAYIARRRELVHAIAMSALISSVALLSIIMQIGKGSFCSQFSTMVLMVPSAVLGGFVRWRSKQGV